MPKFKVIKYRRKSDKWAFAVVEKRFFSWLTAKVVTFTDSEDLANRICDALNDRKAIQVNENQELGLSTY